MLATPCRADPDGEPDRYQQWIRRQARTLKRHVCDGDAFSAFRHDVAPRELV